MPTRTLLARPVGYGALAISTKQTTLQENDHETLSRRDLSKDGETNRRTRDMHPPEGGLCVGGLEGASTLHRVQRGSLWKAPLFRRPSVSRRLLPFRARSGRMRGHTCRAECYPPALRPLGRGIGLRHREPLSLLHQTAPRDFVPTDSLPREIPAPQSPAMVARGRTEF